MTPNLVGPPPDPRTWCVVCEVHLTEGSDLCPVCLGEKADAERLEAEVRAAFGPVGWLHRWANRRSA